MTSTFVPFVPGTRTDSRRNLAALALLQSGATEVVVLEEPFSRFSGTKRRTLATSSASAKVANFKKRAEKAGFKVHAFTRVDDEQNPTASLGVVQVLGASGPVTPEPTVKVVPTGKKREFALKADGRRGRKNNAKPGLAKASADRTVAKFLNPEDGRRRWTASGYRYASSSLTEETTLRRANARAQALRDALKRAGAGDDYQVRVKKNASGVNVVFAVKK